MVVVGLIEANDGKLFNTAIVVRRGELIGRYRKVHLLAAERAFSPGSENPVFEINGLRFGINICYDTNFPDMAQKVAKSGATLIVCCANNMLSQSKAEAFRDVHNAERASRCRETGLWLVSSDITGERDGMVSWGPSAVLSPTGEVMAQLPLGQPGLLAFDVPVNYHMNSGEGLDTFFCNAARSAGPQRSTDGVLDPALMYVPAAVRNREFGTFSEVAHMYPAF